jgi:hypothetical protein
MWKDLGITDVDLYHADPTPALSNSHWAGANIGVNNGISDSDYNVAKSL